MSTSSFSCRPVMLDSIQFYSGTPKAPKRAPPVPRHIEQDDYMDIDDLLASSEMPANSAREHERSSPATVGAGARLAHGRRIESAPPFWMCCDQDEAPATEVRSIDDLLGEDGVGNFNPPAGNHSLQGQTRVEVDLTLDADGDLSSQAADRAHQLRGVAEENGASSQRETAATLGGMERCMVLTPATMCDRDALCSDDCDTTTSMLETADVTALYQDVYDLRDGGENVSVAGCGSGEAQGTGVFSQSQLVSQQPCASPAGTRSMSLSPSEPSANVQTMTPRPSDRMESPKVGCVTDPSFRSGHHAPLPTPPESGTTGGESEDDEMPFVPTKRRRRFVTRRARDRSAAARDRRTSPPCSSTDSDREDTIVSSRTSSPSSEEKDDPPTASILVGGRQVDCILTTRGSSEGVRLSIEIPLSALCGLGAPNAISRGVVRQPRLDSELRRSYKSVPSAHRMLFSKKEDRLLKKLKEQRDPMLSWREIETHFPHRTRGSLQVRYCTRLNSRRRR